MLDPKEIRALQAIIQQNGVTQTAYAMADICKERAVELSGDAGAHWLDKAQRLERMADDILDAMGRPLSS